MNNYTKCMSCSKLSDKGHKLDCLHYFCNTCLSSILKDNILVCYVCNSKTNYNIDLGIKEIFTSIYEEHNNKEETELYNKKNMLIIENNLRKNYKKLDFQIKRLFEEIVNKLKIYKKKAEFHWNSVYQETINNFKLLKKSVYSNEVSKINLQDLNYELDIIATEKLNNLNEISLKIDYFINIEKIDILNTDSDIDNINKINYNSNFNSKSNLNSTNLKNIIKDINLKRSMKINASPLKFSIKKYFKESKLKSETRSNNKIQWLLKTQSKKFSRIKNKYN